uniref:VWFA domain-containing protein n=1 Tax=Oryzias latipes TaxID=8090 RepID=A0A3P9MDK2_ORYLA
MIRKNANIGKIAAKTTATCRSCNGDDCSNNILENIIAENILTSGYAVVWPWSGNKPKGKCSHGGFLDAISSAEPKGGINKDSYTSSHGHLHREAAELAISATSQLLEDIRGATGDREFLQLMGISKGSNKALCFVVDTTRSMGDDIAAVRTVTSTIIDSKVGTEDEPSLYILVPFNDPDFGPLMKTTDAEVFKGYINSLRAYEGGDTPEMSLSGLQLALTGSPPNSEIFLFTDAPAKDEYLKNTVIALIEQSKTVVNFMITNILGFHRCREANENQQQQQNQRMVRSDSQLYRDLAQASGGQAIQVSKTQLLQATSIITESTSSSLVTLLQASRNLGRAEMYTFIVDETLTNLIIYITGSSVDYTLVNPSGELHNSTFTGPSIITGELVGNLRTLRLPAQVGLWELRLTSTNPYTLRVIGQSPIDFIFRFIKQSEGPLEGFDLVENRPTAGVNTSLQVILLEGDISTVTEVTLVESSGSGQVNGLVEAQGGGQYLVHFDKIPSVEFVVLVRGQSTNSTTSRASSMTFQRQSTTSLRASSVSVTLSDTESVLEPGTPLLIPFSVTTTGKGGNFVIKATNDQGFDLTYPSSLTLESGGSANGTARINAPLASQAGTGVTLTIEAEAPGGADANYDVLRLTVLPKVTDFSPPVCQLLSLQSNCSDSCNQSTWELSVQVTDGGNGTAIDSISLREGDGILNFNMTTANVALVSYNASCCSPNVQLVVVDRVGNVEVCSYSVAPNVSPTFSPTIKPSSSTTASSSIAVQPSLLCLSVMILGLMLGCKMH